jgi:hypothetical protein
MELSAELLFILSLLSSVIVWVLKKAFVDQGKEVPTWVYNLVLGAVALVLSVAFAPVVLPPLPPFDGDLLSILSAILAFVSALIPVLVAVVGFARIIYEVILQKILEGLNKRIRKALGSDIG